LIKAKKSLGQNFLKDKNILEKIVNTVSITNKTIMEVGPGTGNLTAYILNKKPKKFYVIEKDDDLVKELSSKFKDKLFIINEDILKIDEIKMFDEKVIVFGNLPYNISTEILNKWITSLKNNFWFENLVLMFQKEVADRIIAKPNTSQYGRLTILSNWKLNVKKICDVKPNAFFPMPKIESSILIFSPKKDYCKIKDVKNLETITRIFFNQRRKMIKKPFNQLFNGDERVLNRLKINLNLRPQNIDLDIYYRLACEYESLCG
tara:strand:+ start:478 stop:1263 length:786 start_codon:yes stop_codon:yes gene_type:complete